MFGISTNEPITAALEAWAENIIGMLQTSTKKGEAGGKATASAPISHLNLGFVQRWNVRVKPHPGKLPHALPGGPPEPGHQRKKAVKPGVSQRGDKGHTVLALKVTKTWQNKAPDCLLNSGWVTFLYLGVRSDLPPHLPRNREEVVLIELCLHGAPDSEDNTFGGSRVREDS